MAVSQYEQKAHRAIELWKNPKRGWFDKVVETINWPLDKTGDLVMKTPGIGWVMEKSVGGIVGVGNDIAQWSVRHDVIFKEYQEAGHRDIASHADVFTLDLEDVDKVIGYLAAKYKGMALVEGAGTGLAGLPGMPVDIIALVLMNLRAIGEYAAYCGFDTSTQQERLFAMNVLGLASSPNDAAKGVAMAQLLRIAQEVAMKKTWKELEKHAFVVIIQQIAKALGIRLTKAKLAQVIPAAGAAIGGGFNAYFTARVCDAAFHLYRERFLAEKHGIDWIVESTKPAADPTEPGYAEQYQDIHAADQPPGATGS